MNDPPTWLRYVALAVQFRVQDARAGWRAHGAGGPHAAVDAVLAELHGEPGGPAARRAAVRDRLVEARRARDADPAFARVADGCDLDELDRDLLALLAAASVTPRLEALIGYVQDDVRPQSPTPGAAGTLFGWPPTAGPGPASALVRWAIAGPGGSADPGLWQADARWELDGDIARLLAGLDGWEWFWPGLELVTAPPDPCLHPELLGELRRVAVALTAGAPDRPIEIELVGRRGAGRRTLLAQLAQLLQRPALIVTAPELGVRALRTARLLGAVPVWVDPAGAVPADELSLVAREAPRVQADAATLRVTATLPALGADARRRLWGERTQVPVPAAVREWALTPAEIERAAATAAAGPDAVDAQLRRRITGPDGALMRPVDCPHDWADLVLPEPVTRALRDLETQVRLAGAVLDDWGLRVLTPEREGTTALFAGPSGTGKTMAATVLARALGLDLYRVDLSQVVDKYIGETEKRLAEVFDAGERSRVIVLFDEADALFGQRTRVRDAHDRFANIEIDYLLSRLDAFDGLAILATNRKGDLDPAFMRRLRAVVDFLPPSARERRALWERSLPAASPGGEPICGVVDRDALAATLELSPAEIKAVALGAAFLARARGELIVTEHVMTSARRELAKRGATLRDERPPTPRTPGPAAAAIGNGNGHGSGNGSRPR